MSPRFRSPVFAGFALIGVVVWVPACRSVPPASPQPVVRPVAEAIAVRPLPKELLGLEEKPGLWDLFLDRKSGTVWALLPRPNSAGQVGQYLYVAGLVQGLGSNPVGLDRGWIGPTLWLEVRRVGGKAIFEALNTRFSSSSEEVMEQKAARESFGSSVIWATNLREELPDGRLLIDLTPWIVRDALGITRILQQREQGPFSLDVSRSTIELEGCESFPENVELEALLTFESTSPGRELERIVPVPSTLTLRVHHSILALPPPGYVPREYDPRMGSLTVAVADYSSPLSQPITQRWIVRHRLQKQDPWKERSPAREPIVYYVDPGVPEPVRQAVLEGAGWWREAFEEAGFVDAFRVKLLPPEAHPLDRRFHVIQWVHRATRGWSYGGGVIDPRTGEVLKGHVILGSLRVRHDRFLFEALFGATAAGARGPVDPVQLALARIRQLAAHEVGHTLGLAHNFAASTRGRSSVMDYPAPLLTVGPDGQIRADAAYTTGIGVWDHAAIRWAYAEFPPGSDERSELEKIVQATLESGQIFLGESDARDPGTAHPAASLWDNGEDPVAFLAEVYRVRERALARFGRSVLRKEAPVAELLEAFPLVYLYHRYQVVATAKALGGLEYRHARAGDSQRGVRLVAAERQRRALQLLLRGLEVSFLDLPDEILRVLPPPPPEFEPSAERLESRSTPAFDPLSAAATAADLVLQALLHPARASRLVDGHRRNPELPSLEEVLDRILETVFSQGTLLSPRQAEIARVVQHTAVHRLIELAEQQDVAPWVRSRVDQALAELLQRLDAAEPIDRAEKAHFRFLTEEIGKHLSRPLPPKDAVAAALSAPPGEPIGSGGPPWAHCDVAAWP